MSYFRLSYFVVVAGGSWLSRLTPSVGINCAIYPRRRSLGWFQAVSRADASVRSGITLLADFTIWRQRRWRLFTTTIVDSRAPATDMAANLHYDPKICFRRHFPKCQPFWIKFGIHLWLSSKFDPDWCMGGSRRNVKDFVFVVSTSEERYTKLFESLTRRQKKQYSPKSKF